MIRAWNKRHNLNSVLKFASRLPDHAAGKAVSMFEARNSLVSGKPALSGVGVSSFIQVATAS